MWNEEDKKGFESESMKDRSQINIESDFGKIIFDLAKMSENLTFIDIGTWNGLGSTKCFIKASSDFELITEDLNSRAGYSVFKKIK